MLIGISPLSPSTDGGEGKKGDEAENNHSSTFLVPKQVYALATILEEILDF